MWSTYTSSESDNSALLIRRDNAFWTIGSCCLTRRVGEFFIYLPTYLKIFATAVAWLITWAFVDMNNMSLAMTEVELSVSERISQVPEPRLPNALRRRPHTAKSATLRRLGMEWDG